MAAHLLFVCLFAWTKAQMASESTEGNDINTFNHIQQLTLTVSNLQSQLEIQTQAQAETTAELKALKKSHASLGNELTVLKENYTSLEKELKQSKNTQPEEILAYMQSLSQTHMLNKSSLSSVLSRHATDETELMKSWLSVDTQLTTLTEQYASLENELVTIKDQFIANGSTYSWRKMNNTINHNGEKIANLQSDVHSMRTSIAHTDVTVTHLKSDMAQLQLGVNSSDTLPASNKAFEAAPHYNSNQRLPVIAGSVMTFPKTLYNVGGCFSNTTGYFTAPTPGTYMFWVTGVFTGTRDLTINILRNGNIVGSSYAVAPYFADGVSRGIIVCGLDDGDKVHFSPAQDASLVGAATAYGGALLHPR